MMDFKQCNKVEYNPFIFAALNYQDALIWLNEFEHFCNSIKYETSLEIIKQFRQRLGGKALDWYNQQAFDFMLADWAYIKNKFLKTFKKPECKTPPLTMTSSVSNLYENLYENKNQK